MIEAPVMHYDLFHVISIRCGINRLLEGQVF